MSTAIEKATTTRDSLRLQLAEADSVLDALTRTTHPDLPSFSKQDTPPGQVRGRCEYCRTPTFVSEQTAGSPRRDGRVLEGFPLPTCPRCWIESAIRQLAGDGKFVGNGDAHIRAEQFPGSAFDPGTILTTQNVSDSLREFGNEIREAVARHLRTTPPGAGRLVHTRARIERPRSVGYGTETWGANDLDVWSIARNPESTRDASAVTLVASALDQFVRYRP